MAANNSSDFVRDDQVGNDRNGGIHGTSAVPNGCPAPSAQGGGPAHGSIDEDGTPARKPIRKPTPIDWDKLERLLPPWNPTAIAPPDHACGEGADEGDERPQEADERPKKPKPVREAKAREAGNSVELPEIMMGQEAPQEGLKTWTPAALAALAAANKPDPVVFQRAGSLCRIVRHSPELAPVIVPLGLDALRGLLDRAAYWGVRIETNDGHRVRYGTPPMEVVRDVASLGNYDPSRFPVVESIAESPRFLADGRLVTRPGYDPDGRFFYAPAPDLAGLEVPLEPTDGEVGWALSFIVNDLLADFPFADQASRANAVALTLLPFVRPMIAGPTPNHHIGASTEGTGKGLLANACAFPALGHELELAPQKESEAEWRKALTTILRSGAEYVFIDNLANPTGWDDTMLPIDSGVLAMVWTATFYRDRILGGNTEAIVKINQIFLSTGNNTWFSRELLRRIVSIELASPVENPSLLTGWKHDPLLSWARENRRDLVRACLILCRRWIAEGMPPGDQVMGSYEAYARVMGGILGACGMPGFLANRPRAVVTDRDALRWVAFVTAWHEKHSTYLVSTADLFAILAENAGLYEQFDDILGSRPDSRKTRLGRALGRYENRVFDGWRITRTTALTANKTTMWRLQPSEKPVETSRHENGEVSPEHIEEEGIPFANMEIDWSMHTPEAANA